MKHFEEAMKKVRPLSSQELSMYKNIASRFGPRASSRNMMTESGRDDAAAAS